GLARLQSFYFKIKTGTQFEIITFKSPVEAGAAVAAGHVHALLASSLAVKPLYDAGKVRLLSVNSDTRDPSVPNVPSFAESSLAEIRDLTKSALFAPFWVGPMLPGKAPREAVDILYAATREIVKDPDFIKRMTDLGLETATNPPTPEQASL